MLQELVFRVVQIYMILLPINVLIFVRLSQRLVRCLLMFLLGIIRVFWGQAVRLGLGLILIVELVHLLVQTILINMVNFVYMYAPMTISWIMVLNLV